MILSEMDLRRLPACSNIIVSLLSACVRPFHKQDDFCYSQFTSKRIRHPLASTLMLLNLAYRGWIWTEIWRKLNHPYKWGGNGFHGRQDASLLCNLSDFRFLCGASLCKNSLSLFAFWQLYFPFAYMLSIRSAIYYASALAEKLWRNFLMFYLVYSFAW